MIKKGKKTIDENDKTYVYGKDLKMTIGLRLRVGKHRIK